MQTVDTCMGPVAAAYLEKLTPYEEEGGWDSFGKTSHFNYV